MEEPEDPVDEDARPIAEVLDQRRAADPRQFTVLIADDTGEGLSPDPVYPSGILSLRWQIWREGFWWPFRLQCGIGWLPEEFCLLAV